MKLFLIDGHALIFKMYYAFLGRPMVNSKGVDTSILYGFTKYLLELVAKEQPTHIAVSFDPPGGTFRNQLYPEYKANRSETPQLVIDALEPLTSIVKALGMPVLMIPGYEADDVIGSAAKRFAAEGFEVYMVTPDKDYGQLVAPHVFQYKPGKSGGESEVLGEAEICAKWGIENPLQVIDVLAICGDASDNVPGVQGVGPVGASKLLAKFGSLEGIYGHIAELTSRQQQLFEAARGHIDLSKTLVTIKTDIPLDVTSAEMELDCVATPEVKELFQEYEFPSLMRHLKQEKAVRVEKRAVESRLDSRTVALMLNGGSLMVAGEEGVKTAAPESFRAMLEDASVPKTGYNMKPMLNELSREGIEVKGKLMDVQLMHYLLDPEGSHALDVLSLHYLGEQLHSHSEVSQASLFDEIPEVTDHSAELLVIRRLAACIDAELEASERMNELYWQIEEPLMRVLSRMELIGVKVDMAALRSYADGLREQLRQSEARVRELAGVPNLNVASPKQLGEVIFEKLKLDPKAKKPRNGNWPTDEQTLTELADRSPIIESILEYRGSRKLLNTYIEPFPSYVSQLDGRVHTTFNQALTSTGRLSSSNPNLQNIPIRTEQGREIRKAFVAGAPGSVIMSADYSQIELRIMAHLCGDEHLCKAFRDGVDVHAATAAKIFHIDIEDVTPEQRRIAKTANFGIMYGISAFGLSQRLKCSRTEAKQIIDDYFESFPSIRSWIDSTLADARRDGYVTTLFGRRRYVPDVNSTNANLRSLSERNAVNAPIQGTSADIIKLAMIGVDKRLREEGLEARMVLQIHDELVVELPESEIVRVQEILKTEMEGVLTLDVPLTVECNYGNTWLEAH